MNLASRWNTFFHKNVPNMILRLAVMFIGLAIVAFSIALTRASGLGTSPISCVPAVLSFSTEWTIGVWTFIFNVLFVLIQLALLRRDFKPIMWLQIVFVFVFSAMIDLFVPFCDSLPIHNYAYQFFYTILGCVLTGFGVFLQIKASLITLPGEGIVLAISKCTGIEVPKCKIGFDCTNGIIACALSLFALGGLFGVREGTVVAALGVGLIIKTFNKALPNFETFLPIEGHVTLTATTMPADSKSKTQPAIITEPELLAQPETATQPEA